jgi:hypothetical protein
MIEEQPKELPVAIIKHRVKRYYKNPGVEEKIMKAAEQKPGLIIAPLYSFLKEDHLDETYSRLIKKSPSTALITGRGTEWNRFPKAGLNPLNNIRHRVSYYPNLPEEAEGLDLLVIMGEETWQEFFENLKVVRAGGYLVRVDNSLNNSVIKKEEDNTIKLVCAPEHKNQKLFDWYVLAFK